MSVLIVEDHPDGADSLAAVLTLSGLRAAVARSVREGEAVAALDPPDVVLADLGLPDGDGASLPGRLAPVLARRPAFVALTGSHGQEARCLAAGFDRVLLKPADPAALAALLTALAAGRPRTPPG